jgi:hypothetical protein
MAFLALMIATTRKRIDRTVTCGIVHFRTGLLLFWDNLGVLRDLTQRTRKNSNLTKRTNDVRNSFYNDNWTTGETLLLNYWTWLKYP